MKSIINFNELTYCSNYINLLVEEIYFNSHPVNLHYGKCCVIGNIVFNVDTNVYFLENIKVSNFTEFVKLLRVILQIFDKIYFSVI